MRTILALIAAVGFASASYAGNPPYEVMTYRPTLATTAGDDMRPTIAGTVVRVSAGEVDLLGGPHVPATASVLPGQWATFVCEHIDTRREVPIMDRCTLRKAETRKATSSNQLW